MEDEECWQQLEDYRLLLIKTIEPSRITPYLRQCRVLSSEDEEQIFNDPSLVLRRRRVGALLDLLQRTGVKGHVAFLESLELDYPHLYRKITGKEPARAFSILVDTVGESGLTEFLMSEVTRLQNSLAEERKRRQEASAAVESLNLKERERQTQQERLQRLRTERERHLEELRHLRDDNYSLMFQITKLSEEKNGALMASRDLQLEIERLKHSLMKTESNSQIKHRRTMTLKNNSLRQLQNQNDLLSTRLQELEIQRKPSAQAENQEEPKTGGLGDPRKEGGVEDQPQVEGSVKDKDQRSPLSLKDKDPKVTGDQDHLCTIFSLKTELRLTQEQRDRCSDEKEVLELECTTLKKDSEMYCQRMEDILKQLEEVITERNKAMASRDECHQENCRNLLEKDQYRRQIHELGERRDELQVQLFRREGAVLALETRLRRRTCSNHDGSQTTSEEESRQKFRKATRSEDLPMGASVENKNITQPDHLRPEGGAGEQADSADLPCQICQEEEIQPRVRCNVYYRRKRALREKSSHELPPPHLDDSSGSDNTDGDGM